MPNTYAANSCFQSKCSNISAEGLYLSAFHNYYYTVLMQICSCCTRKQTCNGEYTKHCTRSRHQLKMAAPAEVSEKRSNFRLRQF